MELLKELEIEKKTETSVPKVTRVCFVCTGNTCRSPMAEAVTNAFAKREGRMDLRAYSAGLFANENDPITPNAVRALEKAEIETVKGRDYHEHTAHTLTAEEAEEYDLLIGMTDAHVMQLLMRFPQMANRILRMPSSVSDPYGGDDAIYEQCLQQIVRDVCTLLFPEIGQ